MALVGAHQADDQEDRADEHMEAVEAGRHEEGRRIVDRAEGERRFGIFIGLDHRSEEHTSELQSLMRISYAVFCLKQKKNDNEQRSTNMRTGTRITRTER